MTVIPRLATLLLAFAFASGAGADAGPGAPVLEIVTFRLASGTDHAEFVAAARGTETPLRSHGGVIRRFLTVDDDGLWTDIIEWSDLATAEAAASAISRTPEFAAFGGLIDADSITMRHAPILWRMD